MDRLLCIGIILEFEAKEDDVSLIHTFNLTLFTNATIITTTSSMPPLRFLSLVIAWSYPWVGLDFLKRSSTNKDVAVILHSTCENGEREDTLESVPLWCDWILKPETGDDSANIPHHHEMIDPCGDHVFLIKDLTPGSGYTLSLTHCFTLQDTERISILSTPSSFFFVLSASTIKVEVLFDMSPLLKEETSEDATEYLVSNRYYADILRVVDMLAVQEARDIARLMTGVGIVSIVFAGIYAWITVAVAREAKEVTRDPSSAEQRSTESAFQTATSIESTGASFQPDKSSIESFHTAISKEPMTMGKQESEAPFQRSIPPRRPDAPEQTIANDPSDDDSTLSLDTPEQILAHYVSDDASTLSEVVVENTQTTQCSMNSPWRFGDLRCLSEDEADTDGVDEDSSSRSLVDSITAVSRSISGDSDISPARNAAKAAEDSIAVSNHRDLIVNATAKVDVLPSGLANDIQEPELIVSAKKLDELDCNPIDKRDGSSTSSNSRLSPLATLLIKRQDLSTDGNSEVVATTQSANRMGTLNQDEASRDEETTKQNCLDETKGDRHTSTEQRFPALTSRAFNQAEPQRLIMLMSTATSSRFQSTHQHRARTLLYARGTPYDTIDAMDTSEHDRRNQLFRVSGMRAIYPQFFLEGQGGQIRFVGNWETLQEINDASSIPEKVRQAHPEIQTWESVFNNVVGCLD